MLLKLIRYYVLLIASLCFCVFVRAQPGEPWLNITFGEPPTDKLNKVVLTAAFDASETLCRFYDSAFFKNNSSGDINSWRWNFGNGQTSDLRDPPVQYYSMQNNETSFTAQLIIKDTSGCADTAYHVKKVASNCFIAVLSAFTPNGDGANDFLYPRNAYKASHLVFRVFDRMGQLIFESKDQSRKWDGSIRGNPQPAGN